MTSPTAPKTAMTIEDACRVILGESAADAIIRDHGVHWAVVGAMTVAKTSDDPRALAAINRWREAAKAEASAS